MFVVSVKIIVYLEIICFGQTTAMISREMYEKLNEIELKLDLESSYRHRDYDELMSKLEELKEQLKQGVGASFDSDTEESSPSPGRDMECIEDGLIVCKNNIKDTFLSLMKGFRDEKKSNVRTKQQIHRLERDIDQNKMNMDILARKIDTILNKVESLHKEIEGSKTCQKPIGNSKDITNEYLILQFTEINEKLDKIIDPLFKSCSDVQKHGMYIGSDVYKIFLSGDNTSVNMYCDLQTDGGAWTVFQRRQDGSEDFFRGWDDYKYGFGDPKGEFWLGNEYLSAMLAEGNYELRVDLEDFEGNRAYARYKSFKIGPESTHYALSITGYSGDAGDSLAYHNGKPFSTKDRDNDSSTRNCADLYKGSWWYYGCYDSNLNGKYCHTGKTLEQGIVWYKWKGKPLCLKRTEMKFRLRL